MPWYKVPLSVYLEADGPLSAQEAALALVAPADIPDGPLPSAGCPAELTQDQVNSWRWLRAELGQARQDAGDGSMVSDGRYPGVKFSPQAAAELAALEFEAQQDE
jgi:hypothetical protein